MALSLILWYREILLLCTILKFFLLKGASTGDLFINQLVRQSSSTSADALFERMVFWPLDGVPIPNEACLTEIDSDRYPTIEQFSVVCSLLGDLSIKLDDDAEKLLSTWSYQLRLSGMVTAE